MIRLLPNDQTLRRFAVGGLVGLMVLLGACGDDQAETLEAAPTTAADSQPDATETTASESTTTSVETTTTEAPPADKAIMFAAIGDFGTDDERQRRVSDLVGSWGPDFIITAGDNRYGNRSMDAVIGGHYCDWLNGVQGGDLCSGKASSVNRFFPSAGNHDYRDGGGISEYTDYFTLPGVDIESTNTSGTELYYDFVQGPVHFFAIDSHGASKDTQKEWLEKTSVASASKWKIVFFHHAAYSSSSAHGSDSSMQWDFAAWGVDAVIAGHDHTYERIEHDGVLYFVNGLGGRSIYELGQPVEGSQVRYNEDNGAMRITADSAEMTFEFVATSGTVIDSRTIR